MGMREWYWGSGKSSSKRGRGGGGGGGGQEKDITTASAGCMCAVFQLFDFHQLQLANLHHHHQQQPEDLTVPKGVEAPRNSLDSSERTTLSSTTKEEENLNSPILKFQMGMQIRTSTAKGRTSPSTDFSSDNSPATKTPSLVARLMGLDLLPDQTPSPSSTSSSSHRISRSKIAHKKPLQSSRVANGGGGGGGTRSLPETPRVSSARRSDVDHHHRLSLQINKENVGVGEDLEFSRCSSYKRRDLKLKIHHIGDQENVKSPSTYARQIVKQVKESVSRKVGLDITNTARSANRLDNKPSRDEFLQHLKSKSLMKEEVSVSKLASPLSSIAAKAKPKPPLQPLKEEQAKKSERRINGPDISTPKSRKASIQKRRPKSAHDIGYGPRLEEAFVTTSPSTADKKCKKTQMLLSGNNVPTLLPIKKDPSPPATKLPQNQFVGSDAQQLKRRWSQTLSSSTSQTYKQHPQLAPLTPHVLATTATTAAGGEEEVHQYVTRILGRTGIDKNTPVSFAKWFSPSHPLDPSIFYQLENSHFDRCSSQLDHQYNRKLLFHAVDEILVDILRPYMNLKPWVTTSSSNGRSQTFSGSQLIDIVCHKIRNFPRADCQVLEDIDALIDTDMPESTVQTAMPFEEEGEGIVREVEKDILDTLIHETARVLWF